MDLLNEQVKHKSFGTGEVVEHVDSYVQVSFEDGKKRFVYPDAFGEFLSLVDPKVARLVEVIKVKAQEKQEREEQRLAKQRAQEEEKRQRLLERERLMKNHRLSPVSQAAFWCNQEEQDQVFADWKVFTGVRKSGQHKGRPNRLVRLHQNSACIITAREPGEPEETRRIVGVFMVNEGFIGRLCEDGYIPAHPKYRLRFSEDESRQLPFWRYYVNERYPHNMTWNSGRHRYFDNVWLAQVLQDVVQMKNGSEQELAADFLEHFCHMNQLEEKELPAANGVLVRLEGTA